MKPTRPILEVESASMLEVVSGMENSVRCVVEAARPAVALRWFLGEEDITVQAATEETPTNDAVSRGWKGRCMGKEGGGRLRHVSRGIQVIPLIVHTILLFNS